MKLLLHLPVLILQMLWTLTLALLLTVPIYCFVCLYYFLKEMNMAVKETNPEYAKVVEMWGGDEGEGEERAQELQVQIL